MFEHHKLLFSFHMCIKILFAQGKVVQGEYAFLLKGGVVLDRENQIDNPCSGKQEYSIVFRIHFTTDIKRKLEHH